ncbi:MAG: hypothetical protein ACRC6O_04410, partial [Flavobacterium sp.]
MKRTKKYRTVVQQFLIEIVLYKYDKQELKTKLRHFQNSIPFNRNWCKLLVINEMIRLKKTIKGDQTMIISLLYKSLKLHIFSANLIKNWVPYKKCIGFYHFQMMRYIKGKDQIIPYLTNSNDLIRSNANISYLALIDLSQEELAHVPDHISKLDQIKIMDIFFRVNKENLKIFDFLVQTNRGSLIELWLIIMTYFNNRYESVRIIAFLNYPSESVRIESLTSIRKLFLKEAESTILEQMHIYSKKAQIKGYQCLAVIGSNHTSTYVMSTFENCTDEDIQLAALYCLQKINPSLAFSFASKNDTYSRMLNHVKTLW